MSVSHLKKLTDPIVEFTVAEKWLISSAKESGIYVQFDYVKSTVAFQRGENKKESDNMGSLQQPLVRLAQTTASLLKTELKKASPAETTIEQMRLQLLGEKRAPGQRKAKNALFYDRNERELEQINMRVDMIDSRNKEKQDKQIEAQRQLQLENDLARIRRDDELKKSQMQQYESRRIKQEEEKKKEAEISKIKEIIEELKRQYSDSNPRFADLMLHDISEEHLRDAKLGLTLERVTEEKDLMLTRERQAKISQRKLESKRTDHLARALREQQFPLIPEWAEKQKVHQEKLVNEMNEKLVLEAKFNWEEGLKRKKELLNCKSAILDWKNNMVGKKQVEYAAKLREQQKKAWLQKCQRAMELLAEDRERQKIEEKRAEERRQREEQERERVEREEKKREERALREQKMMAEIAEREAKEKEREERRAKEQEKENANWRGGNNSNGINANGNSNRFGRGDSDSGGNLSRGGSSTFKGGDRDSYRGGKSGNNKGSSVDNGPERGSMFRGANGKSDGGRGGKSDNRNGGFDDDRFGNLRGGGGDSKFGGAPPPTSPSGDEPAVRPVPAWKKHALEKKAREAAQGNGQ